MNSTNTYEPDNHRAKWNKEQDEWLLNMISKISIDDIAIKMKRTPFSIKLRLSKLTYDMVNNGCQLEDVISKTKISADDYLSYKTKHEEKEKTVFYAVAKGRQVGIFNKWIDCKNSIDGFTDAKYKKFISKSEAIEFINSNIENKTIPIPKPSDLSNSRNNIMTPDQLYALDNVKNGNNIFITGAGGVGKSFTIASIINWAKQNRKRIGVTATTGSAAILIGGQTIHSYLNIGLAKDDATKLANNIKYKTRLKLNKLDILIIDEISMMNEELFDKISIILSNIRVNHEPFGGVQIILVGDMFQLPPVVGDYCFTSEEWKRANITICNLTTNLRHKDEEFQSLLNRIRIGKPTTEDIKILESLKNTKFADNIIPTRLYSLNIDVDKINTEELLKLTREECKECKTYKIFPSNPNAIKWSKSIGIPEEIKICEGAQVVLTWNLDQGSNLVNGSRGIVTEVRDTEIIVNFINAGKHTINYRKIEHDDDSSIWVEYIPIKLAWALSCHKSQGMTLDAIEIDIGDTIFSVGHAYTALSRARSLENIKIVDVKARSLKASKKVKDFYGIE